MYDNNDNNMNNKSSKKEPYYGNWKVIIISVAAMSAGIILKSYVYYL